MIGLEKSGHDTSVKGASSELDHGCVSVHKHCLQLWNLTSLIPVAIQHSLLVSKGRRSQKVNNSHHTIKTTSFTPPNVIKLHLLFAHAFTCLGFLVSRLQKAHQLFKGNYHYMIHSYIK
jgi:hypothetical protein